MAIADVITEMISPSISDLGFGLWGVEFVSSGKYSTLRIYIDSDNGIMATDCEIVSRQVSSILDVEDPISTAYTLEVSSPGMERPLFTKEHFHKFLGFDVDLRLFRKLNGQRKFNGSIKQIEGDILILATNIDEVKIDLSLIDKANLVAHF